VNRQNNKENNKTSYERSILRKLFTKMTSIEQTTAERDYQRDGEADSSLSFSPGRKGPLVNDRVWPTENRKRTGKILTKKLPDLRLSRYL